jgi:hypothetical protein
MSSGSWLTLHNCEIFYLLAVNYDPAISDLIFIRVNIYPGSGERGLQLIFIPIHFIRVTIYPAAFPHNISRGHYLPKGAGEGADRLISLTIYFIRSLFTSQHCPTILAEVTIYPATLTAWFWLVSRPLFTLGL